MCEAPKSMRSDLTRFGEDCRAVSPVVGVILMVAITVILATVIAAFVFGLGSGIEKPAMPAVAAERINETHISLVLWSAGGAASITNCTVNGDAIAGTGDGWGVGEKFTVEIGDARDVTVVCEVDGVRKVVLSTRV